MKAYYKPKDFIGHYLKAQRHKNVTVFIKGKLLDIACGENSLVHHYGDGIGVDVMNFGADLVVESYENLPYDANSFDTITILASINYFEEPHGVLKEIYRLLKPEGRLVITNSNLQIMKLWHLFREKWAYKPGYSYKELSKMLEANGFKVQRKKSFNFFQSYVLVLSKV